MGEDDRQSGLDNFKLLVAMRFWETPVHIPNTMVKTKAADDTILVTVWESRWLPDHKRTSQLCRLMIYIERAQEC